ncbi:MAG TPA: anthranilate synthase component I family protein, partial [Planctomycetota bacterium]|nr:anthranilate synthase component I family protein [Planctomycetota bacterium]
LERELLADEKELAEHRMLVDLGRNDIGRVAEFGSVRVSRLEAVERYSHVMHIVSQVEGRLSHERSAVDAFRAGFPAGTVSGAPKIRAMEIIDDLERCRRGTYAGAVGYIDFAGNLDTCIAIRTLLFHKGVATAQAGAGIVADSVPENEYLETIHKASALYEAIRRAEAATSGGASRR